LQFILGKIASWGLSLHDGGIDHLVVLHDIEYHQNLAGIGECMSQSQQEKRAARRFALRVPLTVNSDEIPSSEVAQIRDVSARGISFYLESAIEQGSLIGFTLTLPPEITLTESIRVQCKGRVVRVEKADENGKLAVAAVIEEYEFLSES
jgi:hypothetical protein